MKKAETADQVFWMHKQIIIPLILIFMAVDAFTLYSLFSVVSNDGTNIVWFLTIGFTFILNFIPLIAGRYIHYCRYRKAKIPLIMMIALFSAFFLMFAVVFHFRTEAWTLLEFGNSPINGHDFSNGIDPNSSEAISYALLLAIVPLVTATINLALGYLISDPIKLKLANLRQRKALMEQQLNIMYAAAEELNQDWAHILSDLEKEQLETASKSIQQDSKYIRRLARQSLARKLGSPEDISELTDEPLPKDHQNSSGSAGPAPQAAPAGTETAEQPPAPDGENYAASEAPPSA